MEPARSRTLRGTPPVVVGCLLMPEAPDTPGAGPIPPVPFGVAGLAFPYAFCGDSAGCPWAALPGFSLLGLAASALRRAVSPGSGWAGSLLLGSIGVGFFVVYLAPRERLWAPVPDGVTPTIAAVVALPASLGEVASAGVFFLGLAVAFGLLALVPVGEGR